MKILRTAVVGLGRIGYLYHVPEIISHTGFELCAVVDVSSERLDEAKSEYGVNGYKTISEMVSAEHPDLVVVASPTHLHFEHACEAMRLGCDVFLDKPMEKDLESAQKIAQCAEQTGRKLMVYQPHRAFAEPNIVKEIIASGKLGQIFSIKRGVYNYRRRNDWQAFSRYGGGMLTNFGAHYIDQFLYIVGEKVRRLNCITYTVASLGDADDVVKVILETENRVMLDLDINMAAAQSPVQWAVFGKYGTALYGKNSDGVWGFNLRWFDPAKAPAITASEELAASGRKYVNDGELPWVEEFIPVTQDKKIDFYNKCYEYYANGEKPFVGVDETLYVMEIIERCHRDSSDNIGIISK